MLDRSEIITHLNDWLEVEYTFLDSTALADQLLAREPDECHLLLDWTRRIASTQIPLAYEFTTSVMAKPFGCFKTPLKLPGSTPTIIG